MTTPPLNLPRILICGQIDPAGATHLQSHAFVDFLENPTEAALLEQVPNYEGLLVSRSTKVSAAVIVRGARLAAIGVAGPFLDNIDVAAARTHNVALIHSPSVHAIAVAEHTMGLLLAVARQLTLAQASLRAGQWEETRLMGTGLVGKTLGIVGFGRIGMQVSIRAQAFGMRVIVNQIRPTPELELEHNIELVGLDQLLQQADFVSLHVPYRPDTGKLISAEQLKQMKSSAYLVNTARSGLIDNPALLAALDAGEIAGAALDLFSPTVEDNPLINHPRILATPHIGSRTKDAERAAAATVARELIDLLQDVDVEQVLPLRVVPLDKILPHESIDPRRVDRLAKRLQEEGRLGNPPIVTPVEDRFMVLDGATRTAALKKLGFPHAVVQVSTSEQGLDLDTWYHVLQNIDADTLVKLIDELPLVSLIPTKPENARDELFGYGALCYLHLADGRAFRVHEESNVHRLDALNSVTEAYIAASVVERTLLDDISALQLEYSDFTALVVFPAYSVAQVMQITLAGRYLPAGITRFVIPGRILRLNADLSVLKSDIPLRDKNLWLREQLHEKVSHNSIRYYAEPVILLDE